MQVHRHFPRLSMRCLLLGLHMLRATLPHGVRGLWLRRRGVELLRLLRGRMRLLRGRRERQLLHVRMRGLLPP